MKFVHMGKRYLFNARSNFNGYRIEFLKKVLAAATDSKIIKKVEAELASRRV